MSDPLKLMEELINKEGEIDKRIEELEQELSALKEVRKITDKRKGVKKTYKPRKKKSSSNSEGNMDFQEIKNNKDKVVRFLEHKLKANPMEISITTGLDVSQIMNVFRNHPDLFSHDTKSNTYELSHL